MIYLDAGATTLEKPVSVRRAMAAAVCSMSSPGRGSHPASRLAQDTLYQCRCQASELFDVPQPEQVIFTSSATHGLNIAIKSLVRPGCRVVISGYEHNAVTRPIQAIPRVQCVVAEAPLFQPEAALAAFSRAMEERTDCVICSHVSNVFGYRQPVEALAELCHQKGVPLIVDASQSAGVLPISLRQLGAAFIAMPGHKGLYGPQGTGLLLCGTPDPVPLLEGGTGSASLQQTMPDELPDRLEAGTHNMPGAAGLLEGLRFVRAMGLSQIAGHERMLTEQLARQLEELPGLVLYRAEDAALQTGVLSFVIRGRDSEETAEALAQRGIAVRAGLHCAPLAHHTAGTLKTGTIRVSPSVWNTAGQIRQFTAELSDILRENVRF